MKRTLTQNRYLHKLIGDLNLSIDVKKELVFQYSGNRTESSSELTYEECNDLIEQLEKQLKTKNRQQRIYMQDQRRNVFKLMYDIALIDGAMTTENKLKVINAWISNKLNINKSLSQLNKNEVDKLVRQLRTVRRIYDERAKKVVGLN